MTDKTARREKTNRGDDVTVSQSYDNVFEAFGSSDATGKLAKAMIARVIQQLIRDNNWTGARAAQELGIASSDMSDLLRGKLARFSQERLERFLTLLDMNVRIVISPKLKTQEHGTIAVELAGV